MEGWLHYDCMMSKPTQQILDIINWLRLLLHFIAIHAYAL